MEKKRKSRWDATTTKMMARINRIKITPKQLLRFSNAVHSLPEDLRGFEGASFLAVKHARKKQDRAAALMFRMQALVKLVDEKPLRGWTFPKTADGMVLTNEEVFRAAASEPLVEHNGDIAFDRASFERRVLELADVETEPA